MASLKDIAERTGLSINTVSRALRESGYVSAGALDKVRAAADELGYAPNRAARSLRFNRNFEIAVLVFIGRESAKGDSMTMDKLIGIKEIVATSGYEINLQFVYHEDGFGEKSALQLDSILRQKPAGVIIIGDASQQLGMAAECRNRKTPVVLISYSDVKDFNCVYIDRAQGVADAVDYFYQQGRRKIVYTQLSPCKNRLRGYRRSIKAHQLAEHIVSPDSNCYGNDDELFKLGIQLAAKVLREVPDADAIQAYSDYLAAGVAAGLLRCGKRIPDDIAIIGFDNRELAAFTSPPLTTLAQPGHRAGKLAVELLLNQLDSGKQTIKAVKVPMNLVIRKST